MNTNLKERVTKAIHDNASTPKAVDAVMAEVNKDVRLMYTVLDKAVTLLGTYPVKPKAQEVYDAARLMREQYRPDK